MTPPGDDTMKSIILTANPALETATIATVEGAATSGYTDMQVLQSPAGFYIGTLYEERDSEGKILWQEPGSRDSGYFLDRQTAEAELRQFEGGDLTHARFHP